LAIARAAGSSSQIARRTGVTRRWLRKVPNGKAGDVGQGRLFEQLRGCLLVLELQPLP
jgi:transposase